MCHSDARFGGSRFYAFGISGVIYASASTLREQIPKLINVGDRGGIHMRASSYVGRVGGLAIVLGIGAGTAILGAGAAGASPEQSAASSAEGAGVAAGPSSARSGTSRPTGRSRTQRAAAAPEPITAGQRAGASERGLSGPRRGRDAVGVPAPAAAGGRDAAAAPEVRAAEVPSAAQTVTPVQLTERPAVSTASTPVAAAQTLALPIAVAEPAEASAAESAAAPLPGAPVLQAQPADSGAVVESVLVPLSGSGPRVPGGSAVSWVMAAAARRELSGSRAAVSLPAAAVSTGQDLDSGEASARALVVPAAAVNPSAADVEAQPTAAVSDAASPREASAESAISPKDNIDLLFSGLNSSIGWIPVVGTVINAVKFAIDTVGLAMAAITLDLPQAIAELGNLVVDTIGLVPVVGAPVASLLYQTVLGGNVKLGAVVQESLQSSLTADSTWSQYQFSVEAVDVAVGLFGSHAATATVSKPDYAGVGVIVDVINSGLELGWTVPLEGRLQLLALAFS